MRLGGMDRCNLLDQHFVKLFELKIALRRSQMRRGFWWGGGLVA